MSKFDAVNVSPHRLRRALGEYRKQSFKNDYVAPYDDVQANDNASFMQIDQQEKLNIQETDSQVQDKALKFDETIDSQGQRPGTLASVGSKAYNNTGLSLVNYNSTSNKLYVKRTPAAESQV